MKSKKRPIELLVVCIAVSVLVIMLIIATYSWIEGSMSPSVKGNDIQLAHSPGLVMTLNGVAKDVIDVNRFIQDSSTSMFVLSEASSSDGVNVFLRDSNRYVVDPNDPSKEYMCFHKATDADKNVSFIEFDFALTADGGARNVWFDTTKSLIKDADGNDLKPIRISLTSTDSTPNNGTNNNGTVILGTSPDYETNPSPNATKAIYALKADTTALMKGQNVKTFSDYSSSASRIYTLKENESVEITARIWLEGGDSDCVDEVSGENFSMVMYFDSTTD